MMNAVKYPGVDHLSRNCRGITLVCNFGYNYLACKPEHKPDDPWIDLPLMAFWSCKQVAQQFLTHLHQSKNDNEVLGRLFSYLKNDEHAQGNYNKQQVSDFIALQLTQRQLLIFPLGHKKALFSNNQLTTTATPATTPVVLASGNKIVTAKTAAQASATAQPSDTSVLATGKAQAVQHWQNIENNADNFPEAFGARLMKLNAEAGYGIAEGAKSTFETLTSWDKFSAAAAGLAHALTNPVETFNAIQESAKTFADLPVGEQGEAAYKVLVGGLASAGLGKVATNAGKLGKLAPSKTKLPAGLHNQEWDEVKFKDFKTIRKVDMANLSPKEAQVFDIMKKQDRSVDDIKQLLESGDEFRIKEFKAGDKLYGLDSKSNPSPTGKKGQDSMYWMDESTYLDVKDKFYKDGIWDKEGAKNHMALPCFNRAEVIDMSVVKTDHFGIESTIGKAMEQLSYTKGDYSTGMLGKIMPGGGTQLTPATDAISAVTRLTGTP